MSSDLTSSSSDKRRRVPVLDPEDFCAWEMMFQAYVGFSEWELFEKPRPELDPMMLTGLLSSSMDPTPASKKYEKEIKHEQEKWKYNNDKVRQALVESLCENKQTKLLAMEFQKLPTKEFFNAVKLRVKDTSAQSLNYHTGILNSMKCHSNEKRMEFADRLVAQFLVVLNLGGTVTPAWRVERLLNGLKAHSKYQLEANLLEMLPSQTWDTITNQLRQYDRSDTNLKQDSANAAFPIICHSCHAVGHKSPDCPMRAQKGGKGRGGGRGAGKGYNGRGGGSKGKGYGGKGGGGGRGGGYKRGGKGNNFSNNSSRLCNLCQNSGHLAVNCPHAKAFAESLKKRNSDSGGNQQRKRIPRD